MRLLVVEDEPQLNQQLTDMLSSTGYVVDRAYDGEEGQYYLDNHAFDLAIIDLGLPKKDGVSVITDLRQQQNKVPVLVLTARDSWQDKVAGLEAGADDYLTKPFNQEELLARVNALLRRASGHASSTISLGYISLDTQAKSVQCHGEIVQCTSYEYKILEYLMLNAGKVISKTVLTENVYEQDFDRDSNVVEVLVGRLRKKIDPDNTAKPIATVRGQGYQFTLTA